MALTNLCILKYNNYFNRIIQRPSTSSTDNDVDEYVAKSPTYYEKHTGVNFYKGDNVSTKVVLNTYKTGVDYLVEYDNNDLVISRWFIIENKQTRAGQTELSLYRDVIADNFQNVINADCYIEKAKIKDINDIAIYNQEDIEFNKIKKDETILTGRSGTAWIVGYMDKLTTPKTITITNPSITTVGTYATKNDFFNDINYSEANHLQTKSNDLPELDIKFAFKNQYIWVLGNRFVNIKVNRGHDFGINWSGVYEYMLSGVSDTDSARESKAAAIQLLFDAETGTLNNYVYEYLDNYQSTSLSYLNNKYVTINGIVQKIKFTKTLKEYVNETISITESTNLVDEINAISNNITGIETHHGVGIPQSISTRFKYYDEVITLEDAPEFNQTLSLTFASTNKSAMDSPYTIFCMPLDPIGVLDSSYELSFTTLNDRNVNFQLAAQISRELGSTLYDLQLLPYSPFEQEFVQDQESEPYYAIPLVNKTINEDYVLVTDSNSVSKQIVFFTQLSNSSFETGHYIKLDDSVIGNKIANQCDEYRICSPNYASQFAFNPCKTGQIDTFKFELTFKPYNPFIHVTPLWSRLYGEDFGDYRGLICQGDFSLPMINEAWTQYQLNNKNYLNAFNRQIESLELHNKYGAVQDVVNAITGAASGAAAGAIATKSAAGAVAGGVISAGLGIADVSINETLRRDNLDLTKDQFNYSLQNIRATPDTLSRISSCDFNNKLFPILEHYSCTDQEKDIFKSKLEFNGMKIMRIDKIINFIGGSLDFVQARLVRSLDLADDTHLFKVIDRELSQGIYIGEF